MQTETMTRETCCRHNVVEEGYHVKSQKQQKRDVRSFRWQALLGKFTRRAALGLALISKLQGCLKLCLTHLTLLSTRPRQVYTQPKLRTLRGSNCTRRDGDPAAICVSARRQTVASYLPVRPFSPAVTAPLRSQKCSLSPFPPTERNRGKARPRDARQKADSKPCVPGRTGSDRERISLWRSRANHVDHTSGT